MRLSSANQRYLQFVEGVSEGVPRAIALRFIEIVEGDAFGQSVLPVQVVLLQKIVEARHRLGEE